MTVIYTGDVIQNQASKILGVVLEIRETPARAYRVRGAPPDEATAAYNREDGVPIGSMTEDEYYDLLGGKVWWADSVVSLYESNPYRRYLAMCAAEDDPAKRIRRGFRRAHKGGRRYGGHLPESVWADHYYRLANNRLRDARGAWVGDHVDLGRARWSEAALDCLERAACARSAAWRVVDDRMSAMRERTESAER